MAIEVSFGTVLCCQIRKAANAAVRLLQVEHDAGTQPLVVASAHGTKMASRYVVRIVRFHQDVDFLNAETGDVTRELRFIVAKVRWVHLDDVASRRVADRIPSYRQLELAASTLLLVPANTCPQADLLTRFIKYKASSLLGEILSGFTSQFDDVCVVARVGRDAKLEHAGRTDRLLDQLDFALFHFGNDDFHLLAAVGADNDFLRTAWVDTTRNRLDQRRHLNVAT